MCISDSHLIVRVGNCGRVYSANFWILREVSKGHSNGDHGELATDTEKDVQELICVVVLQSILLSFYRFLLSHRGQRCLFDED